MAKGKKITHVNHIRPKGEPIENSHLWSDIPPEERHRIGGIILDNILRPFGYERIDETA